jgi:hypothetical protein
LKIKKIVLNSAVDIFTVAWFAFGLLENSYVYYPRSPRPEEGKTVPHEVKGIVVYITEWEQRRLSWLAWIEVGSAAIAGLVILIHRGDPYRSKE